MQIAATGFAWYNREDYPRILEIMTDAGELPETYDGWLERAESAERELKANGVDIVRAIIKPDPFLGWCATRGLKPNASARTRFGSDAAAIAIGTRDANSQKTKA